MRSGDVPARIDAEAQAVEGIEDARETHARGRTDLEGRIEFAQRLYYGIVDILDVGAIVPQSCGDAEIEPRPVIRIGEEVEGQPARPRIDVDAAQRALNDRQDGKTVSVGPGIARAVGAADADADPVAVEDRRPHQRVVFRLLDVRNDRRCLYVDPVLRMDGHLDSKGDGQQAAGDGQTVLHAIPSRVRSF